MSFVRYRVTGLLAASAAIAYLCRTSLSVAEKTIRTELEISEQTMGLLLGAAFFWPYALAQVPGGWMGQRLGARRHLPIVVTALSIASAMFTFATNAVLLIVARVVGGLAQAGLFPCCAATIARWHTRSERAMASGAFAAAMSIGAAVGAAVTGALMAFLSWRVIFAIYAVPGLLWSLIFYAWFRNDPAQHPAVDAAERKLLAADAKQQEAEQGQTDHADERFDDSTNDGVRWWRLVMRWNVWLICGQQFFRAAGYAFFTSWFATYLQETRGVTTATSGWLLSIPLLATVAGALAGGAISDAVFRRTQNLWLARSLFGAVALFLCGVLVLSAYSVASPSVATLIIGAGAFCAALAGPCAYAATMDFGGKEVPLIFGTMNMIGNLGAGLFPLLVPWFRVWIDQSPSLLQWSGGNSWNAILPLFGFIYFWGAACWIGVQFNSSPPETSQTPEMAEPNA